MHKKKIKVAVYLRTAPDNDNEFEFEKRKVLSLLDLEKVSVYKIYVDRNFKDKILCDEEFISESPASFEKMFDDMQKKKFSSIIYRDISHSDQKIEDVAHLSINSTYYNCDFIEINNKKAFSNYERSKKNE